MRSTAPRAICCFALNLAAWQRGSPPNSSSVCGLQSPNVTRISLHDVLNARARNLSEERDRERVIRIRLPFDSHPREEILAKHFRPSDNRLQQQHDANCDQANIHVGNELRRMHTSI